MRSMKHFTKTSKTYRYGRCLGSHAQMVHAISRNFTIKDTNQIMEQLIQRCQGNLDQYIRDEIARESLDVVCLRHLLQNAGGGGDLA